LREIGFVVLHPGVLGVFISNEHVGQIRHVDGEHQFVLGKSRKPIDADSLRAIASKIEMMNHG
jgi:hypothetical protein